MRVLIHNSDSPHNRGDRAILAGNIELARHRWPGAEIVSLSQYPERDAAWFGIRFLPVSPYSTGVGDMLRLLRAARSADVVLWGGGEILKDYTNKLGLVYWLLKLVLLRAANRHLVGAFQGIGPTTAGISKRLIRATVDLTEVFLVRDDESREKLRAWGVRTPVISSFDPAVVGTVTAPDQHVLERLERTTGLTAERLDGSIGIGVRRWFHYKRSGWIPFRFIPKALRRQQAESAELQRYRQALTELIDRVVERWDADVVFYPMHMEASEGDAAFAREVIAGMREPGRAHVVEADRFSPAEYAGLMSRSRLFIASRLHSAIVATIAGVPATVLYYVDKGRLFFEQIGMQRFARPIKDALSPTFVEDVLATLDALDRDRERVVADLAAGVARMSDALHTDFAQGTRGLR
ncbi:polysaccharide pyruvyl transferase family protein [Curtobacterium sp. MCLR17_007]|uniref:polysaccharide pyruvyl transferase family protein n=1 Tax=Curtobacterium sp. MCLR17_007 TaxID=2175648 RepID=UPI0015E8E56B|nr:polysaccharide pyruvyl transferase family protein [Curtobacterium sp. MCLR17_007]WIB59107.1 polysaccharide pyruvyl transferase family protein [Curtobacterium sp. MCLR17_007]